MSNRNLLPDGLPKDPIARLRWLNHLREEFDQALAAAFQTAYFDARLQGHLVDAIAAGLHSRKKILAMTRAENEARGRAVRWRDGVDPTSSAYEG